MTVLVGVVLPIAALPATVLQPRAFEPVLLKDLTPHSWMLSQLRIQANGLSGILDQFWPQVSESVWIGHRYQQFAGGERATYWLNGQVPLHHLLSNANSQSPEALRTGASVNKYMGYIVDHQDAGGWLGPGANSSGHGLFWARYYLLYAFANRAEATLNATLRTESINVMLRHVHATARMMTASGWYTKDGGWGTWRMQEYLLVLQWLVENAPASEIPFLMQHAADAVRVQKFADYETWFSTWDSPHCRSKPPAPTPGTSCPSPSSGPLPSLPPPPGNYQLFKSGVFCCDQQPCTKDKHGHDHSVFLKTMNCDETACFKACDADPNCNFVTKSKPHNGKCGACFLEQHCNSTGIFVPFKDPLGKVTGDRGDTFRKIHTSTGRSAAAGSIISSQNSQTFDTARTVESLEQQTKQDKWPRCGMITHGVNTAQAIKSAAVLWRFSGNGTRLKQLSDQRMASLDGKYGLATGLFCADESLCAAPSDDEPARKSPSRGTELCSVVESMYSCKSDSSRAIPAFPNAGCCLCR